MDYSITVEDLPDDRDLLIPVNVSTYDGEDAALTCFAEFKETVREYAEKYSGSLLSRDALGYLFSKVDPVMKARGYSMPDDAFEIDLVALLREAPEKGPCAAVNSKNARGLENLTGIDIDEAAMLHQEAFVCVEDGKIVSVAVENFCEDGCVEIACETAEGYRGRGYAFSACAALCRDIMDGGYAVKWQCSENNAASVALARKLGFTPVGREMYMCYFSNENGEDL